MRIKVKGNVDTTTASNSPHNTGKIESEDRVKVVTVGKQGLPGPHIIAGAYDLDNSNQQDGALLNYDENRNMYVTTNTPKNITFNCGNF